jgi:hypothetical protein
MNTFHNDVYRLPNATYVQTEMFTERNLITMTRPQPAIIQAIYSYRYMYQHMKWKHPVQFLFDIGSFINIIRWCSG